MTLLEKIISYFDLLAKGVGHKTAVKQFAVNPLTLEDKVVIVWVVFTVFVIAVLMYDARKNTEVKTAQEQQRIAEHQRKVAENQAIKHELIVLTMLQGGYLKVDGVTRKACIKDTNGECL